MHFQLKLECLLICLKKILQENQDDYDILRLLFGFTNNLCSPDEFKLPVLLVLYQDLVFVALHTKASGSRHVKTRKDHLLTSVSQVLNKFIDCDECKRYVSATNKVTLNHLASLVPENVNEDINLSASALNIIIELSDVVVDPLILEKSTTVAVEWINVIQTGNSNSIAELVLFMNRLGKKFIFSNLSTGLVEVLCEFAVTTSIWELKLSICNF